jgi:uncharacterized membrane protein YeaQ/YmgE (transglycosylase-associated protein family)
MDSMREKAVINTYIWCAVGAAIGFVLGSMLGKSSRSGRIEDILVGVFGAFIGGEFVADLLRGPIATSTQGFGVKLMLAVAGALTLLGLLALMRRSVGPMRNSKSRARNRN